MSAFIVADKTINRIVTYLLDDQDAEWTRRRLTAEVIEPAGSERLDGPTLGPLLFDLNVRAVEERYGKGKAKEFRPLDYRYHYELADYYQVLKSLRCWLYQCTKVTVDEAPLYRIMDDYADSLALSIVGKIPAYQRAEWA